MGTYLAGVRRLVERQDSYSLFRYFPHIPDTTYGEEFHNIGEEHTILGDCTFRWLVSIKPSHLVYQCGDNCYLEPYLPRHFARKFGYDQLYVGNPNPLSGVREV